MRSLGSRASPRRLQGSVDVALVTGGRIARGCELCFPGLKAVIFVTGLCDDGCFYCPVNRDRLGRDVFYVNEEPVSSVEEALVEVARQGAEGASLTGGDPLIRPERTIKLVSSLKDQFGDSFHIHLYTSGRYATRQILAALDTAGLDEIRFHPTRREFVARAVEAKRLTSMSVGFEIPIAPGLEEWAINIIRYADKYGLDFVNLNEMEFVAPNAESLLLRGYTEDPARRATVKGSLQAALRVLRWAEANASVPVHFCPAPFKDRVQTWNRLRRTARLDRAWFEHARGPLLRWGEVLLGDGEIILLPPDEAILAGAARKLGGRARIVDAYPTRRRMPRVSEAPIPAEATEPPSRGG
jgi:pyruvate formate-lyase activating enzyme-like uncharacterized protein